MLNKDLKRRIIEISYKNKLSHIGSNLTAVDIIDEIYSKKKSDEKFILSSGHAGLALYCILEKYEGKNAEDIWNHHGVHPDRCLSCGIDCSAGSLGHGLPVAVGMALADRTKNVYCLISDGEMAEGSISEAFRIAEEQSLTNLHVYLNSNGWGAYRKIPSLDIDDWTEISDNFTICHSNVDDFPFLKDQDAHYHVMTEKDYKQALEILQ